MKNVPKIYNNLDTIIVATNCYYYRHIKRDANNSDCYYNTTYYIPNNKKEKDILKEANNQFNIKEKILIISDEKESEKNKEEKEENFRIDGIRNNVGNILNYEENKWDTNFWNHQNSVYPGDCAKNPGFCIIVLVIVWISFLKKDISGSCLEMNRKK